jgi:hypothetical protein
MQLLRGTICLLTLLGSAAAQTPGAGGPAPRTKAGKPDFSGVWSPDGKFAGDFSKALMPGEKISMLPAGEKAMKERKRKDDPAGRCLPMGVPRLSAFPEKIVQTPSEIFILDEGDIHTFRIIYMNSRPHPPELGPSWYGDSIGKWDGDTLVVDTIGFNDRTWLDSVGHPHTEQLHVIERYKRPDAANLQLEVKIEDPGAYAKPFSIAGTFKLAPPSREIRERYCYTSPADK